MNKSKKSMALILIFAMAISMMPMLQCEVKAAKYGDYYYLSAGSDGEVNISAYVGKEENLILPSEIEGNKVVGISNGAFYGKTTIKTLEIPEGVTWIGESAFEGCTSLQSINIPSWVSRIEYATFRNCSSLDNLELPEGLESIADNAFTSCTSLKNVTIPSTVISIGAGVFYGCVGLSKVVIPAGVVNIGESAFTECSGLEYIKILGMDVSIGSGDTIPYETTIYAYKGSTAETHAIENYINFVEIKPIEINGYQMNVSNGGIRTVYSAESKINGFEVVERGLIYGLKGYASEDEINIEENSDYVMHAAATSAGVAPVKYGTTDTAISYVMTLTQDIKSLTVAGLEAEYYVRAYAKLSDGSYTYSDVGTFSIYGVSKALYDRKLMGTEAKHNYLFNNILSVVNPEYEKVEYPGVSSVVPIV